MMTYGKRLARFAGGGLLAVLIPGIACAIPVVDVVDPVPDIEVSFSKPEYTFTHDISDGVAPYVFVAGTDIIDSATIAISFTDDGGAESIEVRMDEFLATTINNIGSSTIYDAVIPSIADLQKDGQLVVRLTTQSRPSGVGDFYFASSTLTAQVTKGIPNRNPDGPEQVSEPATLALLGVGLAVSGLSRRMRRKQELRETGI